MKLIPDGMALKLSRDLLKMKKHSPQALFAVGIAGVIGSAFLACRATLKLEETMDEFKEEIDAVTYARDNTPDESRYAPNVYRKDLVRVYSTGTISLVKLYGPAILIGGASIAALTGSHITLTRRNAGLTAAYSALSASFDAYRERVKKEIGEERELEIRHAVYTEEQLVNGKKELVKFADTNGWSPYARFFDEGSPHWKKHAEHNRIFLKCNQNYVNHLLTARGHVFLNEVYDMLGIERTKAGQVVGWISNSERGDGYISFGIFEATNAQIANNWEPRILLDFNVDGVIYDLI